MSLDDCMRPVIVGAGPIGSYTARLLSDLEPLLIEQRKEVGIPVQCTGLMSTRLRKITNYPDEIILNKIKGAKFFSNNNEAVLMPGKVMAHVIDRSAYDKWMNEGINTNLSERFLNFESGYAITSKNKYGTSLVIDCSGPKKGLLGVQYVTKLERDPELVELHFNVVPDFFAWVVPEGNGYCRVGLASKPESKPKVFLDKFMKEINACNVKGRLQAGLIPLSDDSCFVYDNLIRVGDSASQVKNLSGGGVVTGLLSAEIACKAVHEAYEVNDFSKSFFQENYAKPWNKSIGKELWIHKKVRNYMNDCDYDELLSFLNKNKSVIEEFGDMDFLSKFALKLVRPGNLSFIFKTGFKLIKSFF